MDTKQNCKIIKKALGDEFGNKNVSVRKGTGTACCWIEVRITAPEATFELDRREVGIKAHKIVDTLKAEKKIELSTFTSDDGYNSEHDRLMIEVR